MKKLSDKLTLLSYIGFTFEIAAVLIQVIFKETIWLLVIIGGILCSIYIGVWLSDRSKERDVK